MPAGKAQQKGGLEKMAVGRLNRRESAFLLIDLQESFVPVIHCFEAVVENAGRLVRAAGILDIPLIVTEQYPKGLGRTVAGVGLPDGLPRIEKTEFSCFGNEGFRERMKGLGAKALVLFGIEAHVCVLQTALDALAQGYEVHVAGDAVSSRCEENKRLALERMRQSGAFIASTEMVLFQLLEKAGTEEFKQIVGLVK